jgi:ribonuclease T1
LNSDAKLPAEAAGYYRRYTVPLAKQLGKGTRRLVVGARNEVYDTIDWFKNFVRIF